MNYPPTRTLVQEMLDQSIMAEMDYLTTYLYFENTIKKQQAEYTDNVDRLNNRADLLSKVEPNEGAWQFTPRSIGSIRDAIKVLNMFLYRIANGEQIADEEFMSETLAKAGLKYGSIYGAADDVKIGYHRVIALPPPDNTTSDEELGNQEPKEYLLGPEFLENQAGKYIYIKSNDEWVPGLGTSFHLGTGLATLQFGEDKTADIGFSQPIATTIVPTTRIVEEDGEEVAREVLVAQFAPVSPAFITHVDGSGLAMLSQPFKFFSATEWEPETIYLYYNYEATPVLDKDEWFNHGRLYFIPDPDNEGRYIELTDVVDEDSYQAAVARYGQLYVSQTMGYLVCKSGEDPYLTEEEFPTYLTKYGRLFVRQPQQYLYTYDPDFDWYEEFKRRQTILNILTCPNLWKGRFGEYFKKWLSFSLDGRRDLKYIGADSWDQAVIKYADQYKKLATYFNGLETKAALIPITFETLFQNISITDPSKAHLLYQLSNVWSVRHALMRVFYTQIRHVVEEGNHGVRIQ